MPKITLFYGKKLAYKNRLSIGGSGGQGALTSDPRVDTLTNTVKLSKCVVLAITHTVSVYRLFTCQKLSGFWGAAFFPAD